MSKRRKSLFEKYGKSVHIAKIRDRWAIVIMPDDIRVDNYYKETHLHPEHRGIHIPTKYTEIETVGLIIECHLNKNKGINKKRLMEELI